MKTITLDAVDIDILIKCLNYVKEDAIFANGCFDEPDAANNKIISRIDYVLKKLEV